MPDSSRRNLTDSYDSSLKELDRLEKLYNRDEEGDDKRFAKSLDRLRAYIASMYAIARF